MTLKLVSYYSDHGDGGGSITLYNTLKDLRDDRFNPDYFDSPDDAEKHYLSALNGDDPYEDGEIDENVSIEVGANADGTFRLTKPLRLHYGQ